MSWSRFCKCDKWVEATQCTGGTSVYRVFVNVLDLPTTVQVFVFGSDPVTGTRNCWTIDPSSVQVCLPNGALFASGPFSYATCTLCVADTGNDNTGGGGYNGYGGGGGGGDQGGGSGGDYTGSGYTGGGITIGGSNI